MGHVKKRVSSPPSMPESPQTLLDSLQNHFRLLGLREQSGHGGPRCNSTPSFLEEVLSSIVLLFLRLFASFQTPIFQLGVHRISYGVSQ